MSVFCMADAADRPDAESCELNKDDVVVIHPYELFFYCYSEDNPRLAQSLLQFSQSIFVSVN